jgi:hypothetical protein
VGRGGGGSLVQQWSQDHPSGAFAGQLVSARVVAESAVVEGTCGTVTVVRALLVAAAAGAAAAEPGLPLQPHRQGGM